jgi:hypothetical protein
MTASTNGSATATVETLTGEVRVLMVGSRQVTLSVARQLDSFEYEDDESLNFTPFGRIRTGAKGEKYVQCQRGDRGAEWFPLPTCRRRTDTGSCHHQMRMVNNSYLCGTFERIELCEYDVQWIGRHEPTGNLIVINAFTDEIKGDEQFIDWKELPLVVLAGLR